MKKENITIKSMYLDEFEFEYIPIFDESEKVHYSKGTIFVAYNGNKYILTEKDVFNIGKDIKFKERVSTNSKLSSDEIMQGLINCIEKESVEDNLLMISNNDIVDITFHGMINNLVEKNYDDTTFSYVAFGNYTENEFIKYKEECLK